MHQVVARGQFRRSSMRRKYNPMTEDQYIDWMGKTGATYRYWFLTNPSNANGVKKGPGNYAFVKRLANGNFLPLYFGESEDLQARIPTHDRWSDALRAGMTHVMAHTTPNGGSVAQLGEERDLIQHWGPVLNTHHQLTA